MRLGFMMLLCLVLGACGDATPATAGQTPSAATADTQTGSRLEWITYGGGDIRFTAVLSQGGDVMFHVSEYNFRPLAKDILVLRDADPGSVSSTIASILDGRLPITTYVPSGPTGSQTRIILSGKISAEYMPVRITPELHSIVDAVVSHLGTAN